MSRLSSQLAVGVSVLLRQHAQPITHYPGNDRSAGASLTAIVELDELATPELDNDQAREVNRTGTIQVPLATAIVTVARPEERSTFLINGEIWYATGRLGTDPFDGGLAAYRIGRSESIATKTTKAKR